ncbi:MAG: response regulator [Proteobacteria bacterium]|nr:response regulator [Pseudomonadota bacterium]
MVKIPIDILLVDDERDFVEMLSLRLEEEGHKVRPAYSGEEALKSLSEAEPDVVILDIKMPGMDGIEALKAIKARHPVVEIILLTGHGAVETAVEGLKSGAFDYLLKPANFEELIMKLKAARQRKTEQEDRIRMAEARALMRRTGDM